MKRTIKFGSFVIVLMLLSLACFIQLATGKLRSQAVVPTVSGKAWIDESLQGLNGYTNVVVWFDEQIIPHGTSYLEAVRQTSGPRGTHRQQMVERLKTLSTTYNDRVETIIQESVKRGFVRNVERLWIVNGFKCRINANGLKALAEVDQIHSIFQISINNRPNLPTVGRPFLPHKSTKPYDPRQFVSSWNIEKTGAPRVWRELGITGLGVKNAVHDMGFKLDMDVIEPTLFRNPEEVPNNGIDDDGNGLVDDFHGFNFDMGSGRLNFSRMLPRGIVHGSAVAATICGRDQEGRIYGVAPNSQWAGLIGTVDFEKTVQWALEMGMDTYNMSYSFPGLGEYRSHWRRVMEHASLSGMYMVSGAGNFGDPSRPTYAAIPAQLRTPEDIPEAVFAAAGIGEDGVVPVFSSKGPVRWMTNHYGDGMVNKPDFATYNFNIETVNRDNQPITVSGNSLAGPHLSGVLALMLEADPDLMPWEAKQILIQTAQDILEPGFDTQTGYGLVDAYQAVKATMARVK